MRVRRTKRGATRAIVALANELHDASEASDEQLACSAQSALFVLGGDEFTTCQLCVI